MSDDKSHEGSSVPDRVESHLLTRALADCGVGAWKVDLVEHTIFMDARDAALFGLEPRAQTMTNEAFGQMIHPDDRERVTREFRQAREHGRQYEIECCFVRPDGDERWLIARGIFFEEDGVEGMAGIHVDVTDHHHVQDALSESRRRLYTLMSNLPGMAYRCRNDRQWTMLFVSEGAESLCGYPARALLSQKVMWDELICDGDRQMVWDQVQAAIAERRAFKVEYRIRHASGEIRWMWEQGCGVFDGDEVVALEGFITDVTARKRAEEDLREADRQKDQFLALLGHELRNPITAIRSTAELLGESEQKDLELERVQGVLDRQSKQMEELIEGLLDISRIARGKIRLNKTAVNLAQVIRNLLEDRAPQLSTRRLEVSIDTPASGVWVQADPIRISQVVENLLMNAVKFTDESDTIALELRCTDDEAQVVVRDTGAGIDQDVLADIFEPFHQAQQLPASASGGLGLGLALVWELVEMHGGHVEASSSGPGQGAEFVVHLPLSDRHSGELASDESAEPEMATGERRQILVVEDDPDIAQVLTLLLDRIGHDATVTRSVSEGLDAIARRPPDLVICDVGLPGEQGYELAKKVRAGDASSDMLLVALTGFGGSKVRDLAMEAGFDEFLTKPVGMSQLAEVIARLCSR